MQNITNQQAARTTSKDGAAVWASIRQAERHARVTNGTIRQAVKRGEIPAYKRAGGKGFLVDLRDVDEWIRTTWNTPNITNIQIDKLPTAIAYIANNNIANNN